MRQILFRGKRVDNGEWVEGDYAKCWLMPSYKFIEDEFDKHIVNPESVGQFTGLLDKNGKRIFEGDVVKGYMPNDFTNKRTQTVIYSNSNSDKNSTRTSIGFSLNLTDAEIIGNIRDNPELI